jgi:hypothetical protein
MKRATLAALLLLGLGAMVELVWHPRAPGGIPGVIVLRAQTLPVTVTLAWDANPASDNVTNYVVRLDGVVVGSPTGTSQLCTITTAGLHTFAVRAVNLFAESPDSTLTVNVVVPRGPTNLRVTKTP